MPLQHTHLSALIGGFAAPHLDPAVEASAVQALVVLVVDQGVAAAPGAQVKHFVHFAEAEDVPDDETLVEGAGDEGLGVLDLGDAGDGLGVHGPQGLGLDGIQVPGEQTVILVRREPVVAMLQEPDLSLDLLEIVLDVGFEVELLPVVPEPDAVVPHHHAYSLVSFANVEVQYHCIMYMLIVIVVGFAADAGLAVDA